MTPAPPHVYQSPTDTEKEFVVLQNSTPTQAHMLEHPDDLTYISIQSDSTKSLFRKGKITEKFYK